jgi:hypothetical protein
MPNDGKNLKGSQSKEKPLPVKVGVFNLMVG